MNIYLVGYRGTGKTSVAPLLAKTLGANWQAVDMDPMLEVEAGQAIADIFRAEGEAGFREREVKLLAKLALQDHLVVATGGGIIERAENRNLLRGQLVAWLCAPAEVLADRLEGDASTRTRRPSLTNKAGVAEITEVLTRRTPLYEAVARWRVDAHSKTPAEIAQELANLLHARNS